MDSLDLNVINDIPVARTRSRGLLFYTAVVVAALLGVILFVLATVTAMVWTASTRSDPQSADAAIVLGAAAYYDHPSPVLRERLEHAIELYKAGRVKRLLLTGGFGKGATYSEAEVSRRYARQHGVASADILLETSSTSTLENFRFAKAVADSHDIRSVLVVSDPMHMRRAMTMARHCGFQAYSSPTQTSRFRSVGAKVGFLIRETYFYCRYILTGT